MFSITRKRSLVTIAAVTGLLAAAAPAGAQGGGADFTRFLVDGPYTAKPASGYSWSESQTGTSSLVASPNGAAVGPGSDGIQRAASDGTSNTVICAVANADRGQVPSGYSIGLNITGTIRTAVAQGGAMTGTLEPANVASDGQGADRAYSIWAGGSAEASNACDAASKEPAKP